LVDPLTPQPEAFPVVMLGTRGASLFLVTIIFGLIRGVLTRR